MSKIRHQEARELAIFSIEWLYEAAERAQAQAALFPAHSQTDMTSPLPGAIRGQQSILKRQYDHLEETGPRMPSLCELQLAYQAVADI